MERNEKERNEQERNERFDNNAEKKQSFADEHFQKMGESFENEAIWQAYQQEHGTPSASMPSCMDNAAVYTDIAKLNGMLEDMQRVQLWVKQHNRHAKPEEQVALTVVTPTDAEVLAIDAGIGSIDLHTSYFIFYPKEFAAMVQHADYVMFDSDGMDDCMLTFYYEHLKTRVSAKGER